MRAFLLVVIVNLILSGNCFCQSKSKMNTKLSYSVGVSQKDFEEGRYLTQAKDENGTYYKMPEGVTLVVAVMSGDSTIKTAEIKEGMTENAITKILMDKKINFDKNQFIIGITKLIFLHNKLVGIK
jgi:hypothetical protein